MKAKSILLLCIFIISLFAVNVKAGYSPKPCDGFYTVNTGTGLCCWSGYGFSDSYCPASNQCFCGPSAGCQTNCCTSSGVSSSCSYTPPPPPPSPPPPPQPTCGDNNCDWTYSYKESCSSCPSDCGNCKPSLSSWCNSNCYAENSCGGSKPLNCGEGWTISNVQGNFKLSTMCCKTPISPGETCGTCIGQCSQTSDCGSGKICSGGSCIRDPCLDCTPSQICVNHDCITNYCLTCTSSQICVDNKCVKDPCSICSPTQNCVNNKCVETEETCFNGIDDNGDGQIDESCGGCADLNEDNKVDFQDSFIFADCAENIYSPVPNKCSPAQFYKIDWGDDGKLHIFGTLNTERNTADFNTDGIVDRADFAILASEFHRTGPGLKSDLNNDDIVDFQDLFLFTDQYGTFAGYDFKCFLQNWESNLVCGQQQCEIKTETEECYSSLQCLTDEEREIRLFCSIVEKSETGKITKVGKSGSLGHCCPVGTVWNSMMGACEAPRRTTCSCDYSPLEPEFWSNSDCLNPREQWACVRTKLLGKEEQLTLEIVKR